MVWIRWRTTLPGRRRACLRRHEVERVHRMALIADNLALAQNLDRRRSFHRGMGARPLAVVLCLGLAACRGAPCGPPPAADPLPVTRTVTLGPHDIVEWPLLWLSERQRTDGSWSAADAPCSAPADDVSATALALSAFLSAGYTTRSDRPWGVVVADGFRWLRRAQDDKGRFRPCGTPAAVRHDVLAANAVISNFGMTASEVWKPVAQRALTALAEDRDLWMPCGFPAPDAAIETFGWGVAAFLSARLIDEADEKRGRGGSLNFDSSVLDAAQARLQALHEEGAATTPTAVGVRAWLTYALGGGPTDFEALKRDWAALAGHRAAADDPEADLPGAAVLFGAWSWRVSNPAEERTRWRARFDAWLEAGLVGDPRERRGMYAARGPRCGGTGSIEATALGYMVDSVRYSSCFLSPFRGTDSEQDR